VEDYRRGYVIRHVADEQITRPTQRAGIGLENIGFHNLDTWRCRESLAQQCCEGTIQLDRDDTACAVSENVGECAAAGSDLEYRVARGGFKRVDDSRKCTLIGEEMLAQSFESGWKSVSRSRDQLRSTTRVRSSRGGMSPVCCRSASNTRSTITAGGSAA
jgi:hypothetical protein